MGQSSRNRMPHPPRPVFSVSPLPVEEPQTRTDQLGLIQARFHFGAPPTVVTGMAMLIAPMQTVETHPDFALSISIGSGSYTAELRSGAWQGHDLTHHFDDNRSNLPYGEPAKPPQTRAARLSSARPATNATSDNPHSPRDHRRRLINVTRLNTTVHVPTTSHTTIGANIRISIRLYKCSGSIRQRPSIHAPFNPSRGSAC